MDKFARFIVNIPQEALPQEAVGVKVALLDDGIDGLHGGFGRETLKDGISFLNHDDNVLPFCFSSIGHGTRMATLIRSMCPHVQLYVVRLDQYPSIDGSQMQPTPESAALVRTKGLGSAAEVVLTTLLPREFNGRYEKRWTSYQ